MRKRVEGLQEQIRRDFAPTVAMQKAILKKRALELARERAESGCGAKLVDVVEFVMAYERYGIEVAYVREVVPLRELTPIPCAPPFVLGVVNIRGKILSLIDIKKFFGMPEKGLADRNRVIVLGAGSLEFGILADGIRPVRRINLNELQTDFPTITGLRKDYLKGVRDDGVIILDAASILSDPGIIVSTKEDF
jgi:purine-binding chemotaxis protein CheW